MNTRTRSNILSALLAAAALFSAPVEAQWMRTSDQLGFYAGAGVGRAEPKNFCSDLSGTFAFASFSCEERDTTWKLSAGYQFHRNIAVEAGYVDLGKYSGTGIVAGIPTGASIRVRAFEYLVLGIIPMTSQLSAYVKAGGYTWDANPSASGALVATGKDSGTDLTFGVGVKYDFTRNLAARVEWQRYADTDINTIGAGLLWHFR